ncbi:MAG: hypothetical protein ACPG31_05445 [Planctomycetota bacterium]
MKLKVDWSTGFPSEFRLLLDDEKEFFLRYEDFRNLEGSYLEQRKLLRAEIDIPLSVQCGDDGEVYDAMIQMPRWENRRWDSED